MVSNSKIPPAIRKIILGIYLGPSLRFFALPPRPRAPPRPPLTTAGRSSVSGNSLQASNYSEVSHYSAGQRVSIHALAIQFFLEILIQTIAPDFLEPQLNLFTFLRFHIFIYILKTTYVPERNCVHWYLSRITRLKIEMILCGHITNGFIFFFHYSDKNEYFIIINAKIIKKKV